MDLSNENIIHIKDNNIEYIQFRRLLEFKNIVNAYTLRTYDVDFRRNFSEEETYKLEQSYDKICKSLNIKKQNIVRPSQSHTDKIEIVEDDKKKWKDVDGLLTSKKDINLMLTYADCTPILLYDPVENIIGNIHSGWRGTVKKIGQKAILKMCNEFGSKPENIIVCIGPCIKMCHFEVDEDVKEIFEEKFNYMIKNHNIIKKQKNKDKYNIDTTLINMLTLEEVGIKKGNIIDSKICTVCNSKLIHSYRKDGKDSGRNIAIIGRK